MGFFDKAKGTIMARKAFQVYTEASELNQKGEPEAARGKYAEALSLYGQAMALGGVTQNAIFSYIVLLLREGQLEQARDIMQDMAKRKDLPDDSRFHIRIYYSMYLWKIGDLDNAIATIRRAANMKMNSTVYSLLGMYLVDKARETGTFEEAVEFNRQALDYDDEDGEVLDNIGQLYEAMSQAHAKAGDSEMAAEERKKARHYYVKAHAIKPRQITTIYYLARMMHEDGDDASAEKLLKGYETLYFSAICPVSRDAMASLAREVRG